MAEPIVTSREPSLTSLVSGIISDAQVLMRQEVHLAKAEFQQELTKTKEAAITFGAGAAMTTWGIALLSLMVVFLITSVTQGNVPYWGSFGIVGGVISLIGVALLFVGKSRAEKIHLVPPQTAETMQENVQWLQNRR